jgi:hypothetical protein
MATTIEYWSILGSYSETLKQYVTDAVARFEANSGDTVNITWKKPEDFVDGSIKTLWDGGTKPTLMDAPTHLTGYYRADLKDEGALHTAFDTDLKNAIVGFDPLRAEQNRLFGDPTVKYDVPLLYWNPGTMIVRKEHMEFVGKTLSDLILNGSLIETLEAIKDANIVEWPIQVAGDDNIIGHDAFLSVVAHGGNSNYGYVNTAGSAVNGAEQLWQRGVRWWADMVRGHAAVSGKVLSDPSRVQMDHDGVLAKFLLGDISMVGIQGPQRSIVMERAQEQIDNDEFDWISTPNLDELVDETTGAVVAAPVIGETMHVCHALAHYVVTQSGGDAAAREAAAEALITEMMTYSNQFALGKMAGAPARNDTHASLQDLSRDMSQFNFANVSKVTLDKGWTNHPRQAEIQYSLFAPRYQAILGGADVITELAAWKSAADAIL